MLPWYCELRPPGVPGRADMGNSVVLASRLESSPRIELVRSAHPASPERDLILASIDNGPVVGQGGLHVVVIVA